MKHQSRSIVYTSPGNCSPVSNSSASIITASCSKWTKCHCSGYANSTPSGQKSSKSFLRTNWELERFQWFGWKMVTHLITYLMEGIYTLYILILWHAREFGWSRVFTARNISTLGQYCVEYSSIWVPPGGTWVLRVLIEYLSAWVLSLSLDTKLKLIKECWRAKIAKVLKIEGCQQLASALCMSQILKNVHRSMQPELISHIKDTGHFNSIDLMFRHHISSSMSCRHL